MTKAVIDAAEVKMNKSIEVLKRDLSTLKAGRANPQILDRIMVDYYGTQTPLKSMANISSPEPRILLISLWDTTAIKAVEKAILTSDLGINPTNDGKAIRLIIPELTTERRKELVKLVKKMGEETKVALRSIRRDALEQLKKLKKENVSEDEIKTAEDKMQKLTDKLVKSVDGICADKEKEIMSV
ncbi:MAG: ribosome recycling factor [Clostridia bacterium]|nr:ribosome recycling factor [Clostridia bacterium]